MRFSYAMLPDYPLSESLASIQKADELGFYAVYAADETWHKDLWLLFAAAARDTTNIRFGRDDGAQTLREVIGKALELIRRHAQAHCTRVTSIPQEPVMEIIELLLQIHAGHASSRSLEHFVVPAHQNRGPAELFHHARGGNSQDSLIPMLVGEHECAACVQVGKTFDGRDRFFFHTTGELAATVVVAFQDQCELCGAIARGFAQDLE